MRKEWDAISLRGRARFGARARLAGRILALAVPMLLVQVAAAQQPSEPQAPPPSARTEPEPRGIFESIGRWFDQGASDFRSHVLGAKDSFGVLNERATATTRNFGETAAEVGKNAVDAGVTAADVTKDAVGAVAKLPLTRVVSGRERCPPAGNGAPDCLAAAEALCRKQGFTSGKSIDFTSAEQCSAKVMLSGRQTAADCTTVTFISRAMCQ